jgi:hypothetical protein
MRRGGHFVTQMLVSDQKRLLTSCYSASRERQEDVGKDQERVVDAENSEGRRPR